MTAQNQMIKVLECEVWQKLRAIWSPSNNRESGKKRDKPISPSLVSKDRRPYIERKLKYIEVRTRKLNIFNYENKIIFIDNKTMHFLPLK